MRKIRIGILAPSEIAFRRFLPALVELDMFEYIGVAVPSNEEWSTDSPIDYNKSISIELDKAQKFVDLYGGTIYRSYSEMIESSNIDCLYIPLPPALHYKWGKKALINGKNILMEKPFTTSLANTKELIEIASSKKLAVHENYMFVFHNQVQWIVENLKNEIIGDLRLINIQFGFPFRGETDFRYNKNLGGGALLDCGGYTIKLADLLLGSNSSLKESTLNYISGIEVDISGSATLINSKNLKAQISFGMDNSYRCCVDLWGSKGSLKTYRIFTAPKDMNTIIHLERNGVNSEIEIEQSDSFLSSILHFYSLITDHEKRIIKYEEILQQSELMEVFLQKSGGISNGS